MNIFFIVKPGKLALNFFFNMVMRTETVIHKYARFNEDIVFSIREVVTSPSQFIHS